MYCQVGTYTIDWRSDILTSLRRGNLGGFELYRTPGSGLPGEIGGFRLKDVHRIDLSKWDKLLQVGRCHAFVVSPEFQSKAVHDRLTYDGDDGAFGGLGGESGTDIVAIVGGVRNEYGKMGTLIGRRAVHGKVCRPRSHDERQQRSE